MFPIPVSIITGFLGSGKTTLLNRLLKDPALKDTAVIINEFGDVGIDHLLVEQSGDGIIELADGCLCCTIRGELVDTLSGLIDRLQTGVTKNLSRVVIETTGLADPVPVLAALMAHPVMLQAFRIDGVITVVDAVNGEATLDNHAEAVKQVAVADRLVLTKTDMPESIGNLPSLEARLRKLNPAAALIAAQGGEASVAHLFNCGLYDPQTKTTDVARWLNDEAYGDSEDETSGSNHHGHDGSGHENHSVQHSHHHDVNRHDAAIRAFTLVHERPVPLAAVQMFFELLQSAHGDNLLRMKGIVCVLEHPERPLVIHGVQKVLHPPVRLPAWPGNDRRTRLVMITKDISETYIRRLFAAFAGELAIDQPDAEALTNNPLAPAGLRT